MIDEDMDLLGRIDKALNRIVNGHGTMRVPPEATDVDIVLSACKIEIQRLQKIESVAIDIKYELSQQRVWAGMDWSYHHLRKERVKACFESLQKVTAVDATDALKQWSGNEPKF